MRIAVCDDDTAFLSSFKPMLKEALNARNAVYNLSFYNDPSVLMDAMEHGKKFDLLFLDIYYDTEKGIQFAKALREKNDLTDIVFMTALRWRATTPLRFTICSSRSSRRSWISRWRVFSKRTLRRSCIL